MGRPLYTARTAPVAQHHCATSYRTTIYHTTTYRTSTYHTRVNGLKDGVSNEWFATFDRTLTLTLGLTLILTLAVTPTPTLTLTPNLTLTPGSPRSTWPRPPPRAARSPASSSTGPCCSRSFSTRWAAYVPWLSPLYLAHISVLQQILLDQVRLSVQGWGEGQ